MKTGDSLTSEQLVTLRIESMENSSPEFKACRDSFDRQFMRYAAAMTDIRELLYKRGLNNKEVNFAIQSMAKDTWDNRSGDHGPKTYTYRGIQYTKQLAQS